MPIFFCGVSREMPLVSGMMKMTRSIYRTGLTA